MAKKTNKTEHVLNLLMNQGEAPEDGAGQPAAKKTAADHPIQEETAAPAPARNAAPPHNVMFVDSLQSEDHPISNAIRESLEREAIQMGLLPPDLHEAAEPDAAPDATVAETAEDSVAAGAADASVAAGEAAETADVSVAAEKTAGDSVAAREMTADSTDPGEAADVSAPPEAPPADASAPPGVQEEAPLPPYRYINVMEDGVSESLMEYMTKLGVCTCDRCRKDVTALALSNLPPKYIVVDAAVVSPLLNFYRSKYSSYIMAELTKACFAVIANPRH